jgi:hypothetical protein
VGEAVIAGACLVRVNVPQDGEEFQFANIAPGNTATLQARVIGGSRILWRESGSGTKWAVVRLGDVPQAIVHFQLQADLELGRSAEAAILSWDGTQWVPSDTAITVHDWYTTPGMWQAYNGFKGLALKNACLERYEIVWMETPARSIEFVLNYAMYAGQALATVTNYYLQGKQPASTVIVYDAQNNYRRALPGAQGKARWNDQQRRYEVVECDQMAIALACQLGSDMCAGSSEGSLTGHTVLTFPPYGQSPAPVPGVARNHYHLAGRAGDACLVLWDEDAENWVIIQVAHHQIEVPIKYRYYNGNLQAKHRKIAVMYCEDETDWRDEIPLVEAEFVDEVRFTGCDQSGGGGGGDAGGGAGGSPGETGGDTPAAAQSSSGGGCGSIEYHTVKAWFFEPPKPAAWKNVLTFQEQAVLVAAAGGGSCITFQEVTVCTPCVGPGDTSQVCANVKTTVDCQCSCSCNCDCNCGDSGGYYPASGGGSGGGSCSCSCSCTCTCQANSVITFG